MRSQVWWYVARSGGIVSWALASLAVIGGLQLSTRPPATACPGVDGRRARAAPATGSD